jgi:hypothetical protein
LDRLILNTTGLVAAERSTRSLDAVIDDEDDVHVPVARAVLGALTTC